MFGVGFWEVMLILIISIIILNPDDYYKLFYDIGNIIGKLKSYKKELDIKTLSSFENNKKNE